MPEIALQPKQFQQLEMAQSAVATWIGVGGGRGAAKSAGADRVALTLALSQPGIVLCVVMRNYDQVRKYHVEPLIRAFPDLEKYYAKTDAKMRIPAGGTFSEIDFSYAESLTDVERRFRSANYKYIIVDQAEQFTEVELREMKNACRWRGGAKIILLFNMGGIGIQFLRKKFHSKDFNENELAEDYNFLHVYPWDNVEWSREELEKDGLTDFDYYAWSDLERFNYFTTRAEYGKTLNALDAPLRNRDLLGSWDSLEGAYFGRVFDREATMVWPEQVVRLIKPWDARWLSQDYGKAHYSSTHWHAITHIVPSEAKEILGWDIKTALKAVITYRRSIVNEMSSTDVGKLIVARTPTDERGSIKDFWLSPDAFGDRDSGHTVASRMSAEMVPFELPSAKSADNDRIGGWGLMYDMLKNTKSKGALGDLVWLISTECPEALETIPLLLRDPKNLDDVLKTDKGMARLEQDVADDLRYGLKSKLRLGKKPHEEFIREAIAAAPDAMSAHLIRLRETMNREKKEERAYWEA